MRKNLPMILIRVIVGVVFLTEGILKFVVSRRIGAGRFAHIGLPFPHVLAPLCGGSGDCGGRSADSGFLCG